MSRFRHSPPGAMCRRCGRSFPSPEATRLHAHVCLSRRESGAPRPEPTGVAEFDDGLEPLVV